MKRESWSSTIACSSAYCDTGRSWLGALLSASVLLIFAALASTCSMVALSVEDNDGASSESPAPTSTDELPAAVRELEDRLVELPPGSPLRFPAVVFEPLDEDLAHARVVGLGEATHGTAEFFELKHRLFRHLVELHGHRALGYEFNFAASLAIDDWVTTGEGSIDDLLDGLSWIQANEEVRALLRWMRDHNGGLPAAERIRFIGIDSQLDMWNLELHRGLFRDRYPKLERELGECFDELAAFGKIDYRALTVEEFDWIAGLLAEMAEIVDRRSTELPRDRGLVAAHLVESLKRSHEFLLSAYQGDNNVRDTHLAENALWIGELLGDGVRYSLWAHNSHIGALPGFHGDMGPGSMGVHLTRRLGPRYLRIATAFTRGSFVAVQADWRGKDTTPMVCRLDSDPPADSINAILDQASADRYLLDLRSIPGGSTLDRVLDAERPMLGVGDFLADDIDVHYHSPDRLIRILDAYDAVVYISDTNGVHPLSPMSSQ